jgi:ferredoxin-NADP reductase
MAFISEEFQFHAGEEQLHNLLHVPHRDNPTSTFMTPGAAIMTSQSPIMAVGAVDSSGKVWTSIWGGEPGFSGPLGRLGTARGNVLVVRAKIDKKYDPVAQILGSGEFQKPGQGIMMSALPINLEQRSRVKIFGREIGGQLIDVEGDEYDEDDKDKLSEIQMLVNVEQSLGNCPKYLNKRHIVASKPDPKLASTSPFLPEEAVELVERSDMFFMSSANGDVDMDTNYRGGPPGFVRILSNSSSSVEPGAVLVYPEYSGNRLYQSLGNLVKNPEVGITFPDLDTGDVLYVTGKASVLTGKDASDVLPHSNIIVKIVVTEARFVLNGLSFRGEKGEYSPYNPPVRKLAIEGGFSVPEAETITAELVAKTDLSPTISRYRFKASKPVTYKTGQWVALDFSAELDRGYSHMRDDDPSSLNDDWIRTFTITSSPTELPNDEFEITVRTHGPVTTLLRSQRINSSRAAHIEVGIKGIGGDFELLPDTLKSNELVPFIAGGVGVTPLLPYLSSSKVSQLRLIWTTPAADAAFVQSVLSRSPTVAKTATIFLTGSNPDSPETQAIKDLGATVYTQRLSQTNIIALEKEFSSSGQIDRWTLCAAQKLKSELLSWLGSRRVEFEDFNF